MIRRHDLAALLLGLLALRLPAEDGWRDLLDPTLSQWEIFMGAPHTSVTGLPPGTPQFDKVTTGTPLGLGLDPKRVFRVETIEGVPTLHISGEIYAGLTTREEFGNYHFSAEVKWGQRKWEPRLRDKRDSGLLYHCTGPHGAFWNVWKRCVEFQVQEGDFGDLILLAGTGADSRHRIEEGNAIPIWDPSAPLAAKGRVRRVIDAESPPGEWTTIEVYTVGSRAIHLVNGRVVLAVENTRLRDGTPLTAGQLQLQSEAAEVFYRHLRIRPLETFPTALATAAAFRPAP